MNSDISCVVMSLDRSRVTELDVLRGGTFSRASIVENYWVVINY